MTDEAQIDVTTFRPGLASIRRRRWYLWLVIAGYALYILTVAYIVLVFVFGMSWIASFFH